MQAIQNSSPNSKKFLLNFQTLLELLIIALIFYTPFVFGSVHILTRAPALILIFVFFLYWNFNVLYQNSLSVDLELQPLLLGIFLFVLYILFQLLPLPEFILKILSPASFNFCNEFRGNFSFTADLSCRRPISVYPQATWLELLNYSSCLVVFILMIFEIKETKRLQRILVAVLLSGFVQSLYGLYGFISKDYYLLWNKMNYGVSAAGTFVNRNHFAAYLGMISCVAAGVLIGVFPDRIKKAKNFKKNLILFVNTSAASKTAVILLFLFCMVLSLAFSLSRMGIMSFLAGTMFMILMVLLYNKKKSEKILMFIVYLIILVALWYSVKPLEKRYDDAYSALIFSRGIIWSSTLSYISDYLIFGSGLGTYGHIFRNYSAGAFSSSVLLIDHAHNDYLELLAETGLIGFLIFSCCSFYFLYIIIKKWKKNRSNYNRSVALGGIGSIIYIIVHSFTDFNLHIYSNALIVHIIAALSYNLLKE